METLALAVEGQIPAALASALAHLEAHPRDAIVMSLPMGAFGLFAFSGMADHDQARVDLAGRHAHHYGDDWWYLTNHGWALTENGDVKHGRAMTERAFEMRKANANAVHALLHAMFEDGSVADADALVTAWIPTYDRSGILHGHILWHQALGALEHGDAARALAIYAEVLRPSATRAPPLNAVTDGASLLWRLQAYGHEVSNDLWAEADAFAQRAFPKSSIPFADVHMALFAAATRNQAALEERLGVIEKRLSEGKLPAGPVVPQIFRAMTAFAGGDYAGCVSASGAGARRGRSHRRQPCAARDRRGHFYRRADEERRPPPRRRNAGPSPAPPALAARHQMDGDVCTATGRFNRRAMTPCRSTGFLAAMQQRSPLV